MAYLKNGYVLMYEKINAAIRNLRATKTRPAASDLNVTYKLADGTEVDPKTFRFISEQNGRFYGSVSGKVADLVEFSIYSGNDLLLGSEVGPAPVVTCSFSAETSVVNAAVTIVGYEETSITVDKGTEVVAKVTPNEGCNWETVPTTCKVNGVDTPVVAVEGSASYSVSVVVNEDTTVIFDTGTAVAPVVIPVVVTAEGDATKMVQGNFDICWNFQDETAVTTQVSKTVVSGTTVRAYVEPNFSAEWDAAPTTCKVNNVDTALIQYGTGGYYYVDVVANVNTTIVFDTGTTRVPPVAAVAEAVVANVAEAK